MHILPKKCVAWSRRPVKRITRGEDRVLGRFQAVSGGGSLKTWYPPGVHMPNSSAIASGRRPESIGTDGDV